MYENVAKYWIDKPQTDVLAYLFVKDNRTKQLIDTMQKYIGKKDKFSLMELGCNSGRNLFAIRDAFPNAYLMGNDINPDVIEFAQKREKQVAKSTHKEILFATVDTARVLQEWASVDVVLSMAHLMHLPPSVDKYIVTDIPRMARKWFFCIEHSSKTAVGKQMWGRDYETILNMEMVEKTKAEIASGDYTLMVFKGQGHEDQIDKYKEGQVNVSYRPWEFNPELLKDK